MLHGEAPASFRISKRTGHPRSGYNASATAASANAAAAAIATSAERPGCSVIGTRTELRDGLGDDLLPEGIDRLTLLTLLHRRCDEVRSLCAQLCLAMRIDAITSKGTGAGGPE